MSLSRRGFLQAMLAAGVAPAVVSAANLMPVVRLASGLLVPGADLLSGDRLLSIQDITREALRLLHQKQAFINTINCQFDASWSGRTVRIRRPISYARAS